MSPTKINSRKPTRQNAATTAIAADAVTAKFAIGDGIAHPQFGEGRVSEIESNKLTIKFIDGRVKQILDDYVKRRA